MRSCPALIAVLLCGLILQPAQADRDRDRDRRGNGGGLRLEAPYLPLGRDRDRDRDGRDYNDRRMSAGEAAQRAQQQNGGGRVLAVEAAGEGYRVKLLRDGEVRVVFVR